MRRVSIAIAMAVAALMVPSGWSGLLASERVGEPPAAIDGGSLSSLGGLQPAIVAGDLDGRPLDVPDFHVDPNSADSIFAGVGSFFVDVAPVGDGMGVMGSGSLIHGYSPGKASVRNYVLTAAHLFDLSGGLDGFGNETGDGLLDVAPEDVTFVLNVGEDYSHVLDVANITLHPDWHGFNNVLGPEGSSINDDLAVVELSGPVPEGIPVYNLFTDNSPYVHAITSVGYGTTGDPVGGYVTGSASFTTRRVGLNQKDARYPDDEWVGQPEMFGADFDGPYEDSNVYNLGDPDYDRVIEGSLGNERETTIGPGDSGGPSFLSDFSTFELITGDDGNLIVLGVNTFTGSAPAAAPEFGSIYGGPLVASYAGWVDSVIVPEPGSLAMLLGLAGVLALGRFARRRRK